MRIEIDTNDIVKIHDQEKEGNFTGELYIATLDELEVFLVAIQKTYRINCELVGN